MRERISAHSGLPESVELRQMVERAEKRMQKRSGQLSVIYAVLDKMTDMERRKMLAEVIKHYNIL